MNIYCTCGKKLEIKQEMGTEIIVFSHECEERDPAEGEDDAEYWALHEIGGGLMKD